MGSLRHIPLIGIAQNQLDSKHTGILLQAKSQELGNAPSSLLASANRLWKRVTANQGSTRMSLQDTTSPALQWRLR